MWPFPKPVPKPPDPSKPVPAPVAPAMASTAYIFITTIRTAEDLGQAITYTSGLVFEIDGRIVNSDGTAHGSGIPNIFVNTQYGATRLDVYKAIAAAVQEKYPGTDVIVV